MPPDATATLEETMLIAVAAEEDHDVVEQGQDRLERGCHVGPGGGAEDFVHVGQLPPVDHAQHDQLGLRPAAGVEFHRQVDHLEEDHAAEQGDAQRDQEPEHLEDQPHDDEDEAGDKDSKGNPKGGKKKDKTPEKDKEPETSSKKDEEP